MEANLDSQKEVEELKKQVAELEVQKSQTEAEKAEADRQTRLDDFDIETLSTILKRQLEKLEEDTPDHPSVVALIEVFETIIPILEA